MINIFKNEKVKVIKPKEDIDVVAILDSKGNKIFQTDKKDFTVDKYPIDLQYLINNDKLDIFDKNSEKFDITLYTVMFFLFFELDFKDITYISNGQTRIDDLFPNVTIKDKEKFKNFLIKFFEKNFHYYIKKSRFNIINYLDYFQPEIKNNEKLKSLMLDFFSNQDFYTSKIDENVKNKITELAKNKRFCFLEYYNNYYAYKNNNTNEEFYLKNNRLVFINSFSKVFIFFLKNKNSNSTNQINDKTLSVLKSESNIFDKSIEEVFLTKPDDNNNTNNTLVFNLYTNLESEIFYYFIKSKEGILNNKYHINGWVRVL